MRELHRPNIKLRILKQNSVLSVCVYNAFCHRIALPDAVRQNLYLVRKSFNRMGYQMGPVTMQRGIEPPQTFGA